MSRAVNRLARRQFRAQLRTTEWRALLLATWLAVALTSFLSLLDNRLEQGLLRESANVLGADLALRSSRPIDTSRIDLAQKLGLQHSSVIQFPSMIGAGEQMILSSVRVVDSPYPLRGEILTEPPVTSDIPAPGTAWVEPRILQQLEIDVGDRIQFGYTELQVSARLISSPDRGTGFNSLNPNMLVNHADLEAAAVLAPGSRAQFRLLLSGDSAAIRAYEAQLTPQLEKQERILSLTQDQPVTGNALANGLAYLRLSALTALLISALTIVLALRRFSNNQQRRSALLMSLGLKPGDLIQLYLRQLLIAATATSLLGGFSGYLLQLLASGWIEGLLPQALPGASITSYLIGPALGFAMLLLLGMPPAIDQARVSIISLLRGDDNARPAVTSRALHLFSFLLLGAVMLSFLEAPAATALFLIGLGLGGALFGTLAQWLLVLISRPLAQRLTLGRLLNLRLRQQRKWHRLQAAVITLLLTLLSVVWISRQDLVREWQAQFPEDTPNYFVINIQNWQKAQLDQFLAERSIQTELYPMIRGRLTELNGQPIRTQLSTEQLEFNALNRELNLTWNTSPPAHNQLVSGQWWTQPDQTEISIEQEMFSSLGLKLGDRLSFDIGGQPVEGVISSVREVVWNSFRPNFYVIFSPGQLETFPATWITSFKLDDQQRDYATELLKTFPSLTLIDIDQLITQFEAWLERLAQSSALVLLMTLGCGLILIAVTLIQALEQRRLEAALLQTLGATAKQTQRLDLLEFALLGLVCGTLAAISAETLLAVIHQFLLQVDARPHAVLWILLPPLASLLFVALGALMRAPLKIEECYKVLRSKT